MRTFKTLLCLFFGHKPYDLPTFAETTICSRCKHWRYL